MITRNTPIRLLFLVLILLAGAGLGCNTYRGLGKDVSNAGDAIQGEKK